MKNAPLVIAGSGRSGTTWVLDVLAEANHLRTVFEPLNPKGVAQAKNFCHRYVRENAVEPELKSFMEKVFSGKLKAVWPIARIRPCKLSPSFMNMKSFSSVYSLSSKYKSFAIRYYKYFELNSSQQITKFIRANLMLDWLSSNFDARIAFIVRHPGAVAASKILAAGFEGGKVWDFYGPDEQQKLLQYQQDDQLKKDYLEKYFNIFTEKLSPVAGHTVIWCIENMLPIYRLQQKNKYVFFYEDIITNPEKEFNRMVRLFGLKNKPADSSIKRPSQQASQEMKNNSQSDSPLTRWMAKFTRRELSEIDTILKFFNVSIYNAYEPMPINRKQQSI